MIKKATVPSSWFVLSNFDVALTLLYALCKGQGSGVLFPISSFSK